MTKRIGGIRLVSKLRKVDCIDRLGLVCRRLEKKGLRDVSEYHPQEGLQTYLGDSRRA
jgi:hypothetical protein